MPRVQINFLLLIIFFSIACGETNKSQEQGEPDKKSDVNVRPNIIYILADDLGYGDLGVYGQEKFSTPNIDKLAAEGMLFTQHYSGSTVCAPSRSSLMTGMHTGHTVIRGNKEVMPEGQFPMPANTYTLAEALQKEGYVTGAFGKWGLGFPGSEGDPNRQGFDTFFGYNCQRMGHHYYPRHLWSNQDSIVLEENSGKQKGIYGPKLIHQKTLEFIADHYDQPFFLYVASIIPHAELAAPEEVLKKHRGKYLPEKSYKGTDEGPEYRKGPYESQLETHAAFVSMINILDDQVGDIVEKVESLGISENTLLIFTSDNGPHEEGGADPTFFNSNGPLKGVKRDLYEGGIRVPMIARWPGKIKSGSRTNHISAFWDVFPTLAEITDMELPGNLDGISFAPTLFDQPALQKKHDYLYWEFHEKGGRQAVRMGDWKGVRYQVFDHPDRPIELYNLSNDISEEHNLAAENPEIINRMEQIIREARTPSSVFTFGDDTYLDSK